jgi:hypothetical protein
MKLTFMLLGLMLTANLQSAPKAPDRSDDLAIKSLHIKFGKEPKVNQELLELKKETMKLGAKAVPILIDVMKKDNFPDKNRWVATFLLGRIMGEKSANFIVKFTKHPNWVLRLASLKTLLALNQEKMGGNYAELLQDASLLVRSQALQNIRQLGLKQYGSHVWAMLHDKRNYSGKFENMNIVKEAIKTVGELKFEKAKPALLKMAQNDKYKGIFGDIDYSLAKITGKNSPSGDEKVKKIFWSRLEVAEKTI